MDVLLRKVKWKSALEYLDDIILYSRTPDKHIDDVLKDLLLYDAVLTLNLEEWELFMFSIDYLGHVLHPGCLKILAHHWRHWQTLISKYPAPVRELLSILGFFNVFRCFVPSFSQIAVPLNEKLRKGQSQTFDGLNNDDITAFERSKK